MQEIVVNIKGIANLQLEQLNEFQEEIKILTEEKYASLKEEILADGFDFAPHVWMDSEGAFWLLDGHQRRTCLTRMKGEGFRIPTIPCVEVQAESLEHARRMVLAGTSQYGTFQPKKITDFIKKTGLSNEQLLMRFHLPEVKLKPLISVNQHFRAQRDNVGDAPAVPKTKPGDVYQLGDHRLMCGDSRKREDVDALMASQPADLIFTDPPYGVSAGGARTQTIEAMGIQPIENDDLRGEALEQFLVECLRNAPLRPRGSFYICYDQKTQLEFCRAIRELGWIHRNTIVWNKNFFGLFGHKGYRPKYELLAFGFYGSEYEWHGGNDQADVWDIPRAPERHGNHPTPKPVALAERAIQNSTAAGANVIDLFAGVGSTLIACEATGRKCFAMELQPAYCDVIVERWEKLTGKEAMRFEGCPKPDDAAPPTQEQNAV